LENTDVQEVKRHIRVYLYTFSALAVLTVVTVAAASLNVAVGTGIFIAMVIATVKGNFGSGELYASFF
jgi:hypothetical protein